jgi:uracil-DNA glycosylase family 4
MARSERRDDPADALGVLEQHIVDCRRCPRLVAWREQVAVERRAAFRDQEYWGRPVPGFGDPRARLVVIGLAPAAHGANRTGRMFTGDRSGDFLYASLFRTGFANQPTSVARDDGLQLSDCFITAPVRCAPPANQPTPAERDACRPYLRDELALLERARVVVALGAFGFAAALDVLEFPRGRGAPPLPRFSHGGEHVDPAGRVLLGCYHVSQQNTFTGRLTEPMLDEVFLRARELVERRPR